MALYDEALVDAQKLREVAENAAKQQILESITPRIRQMINSRILFEAKEDAEDTEEVEEIENMSDVEDVSGPEGFDDLGHSDDLEPGMHDDSSLLQPASVGQGDLSSSAKVVINNTGDIKIKTSESYSLENDLNGNPAKILERAKARIQLARNLKSFDERFSVFKKSILESKRKKVSRGQKFKLNNTYRKLVSEAVSLKSNLDMLSCGGGTQRLERKLILTLKEMRTMSDRTKKNIFDFLFEGEDNRKNKNNSLKEAELKLSKSDADMLKGKIDSLDDDEDLTLMLDLGGEDEAPDVEEEEMDLDLGGEDEEPEDEVEPEDDDNEDEDNEGDEMSEGDDMYEMNYDEGDHYDDMDESMYEGDDMGEEDKTDETVYEIDESALRRELSNLKALRESRKAKTIRENAAEDMAGQFGGGEVLGDVFYDIDEDKLINVLADELGSMKSRPKPPSSKHESVRVQAALKEASEYKKAAQQLQGQLVEMNLFNAKLLYANKLMQNKNLNLKQQRAIVEALDNAKTLREAKLLYKSLSESLARRGQASGNLSESVNRTVGSSSRSTRSAQPASSGVEVDRWAVLAGIRGGDAK